jgi:hypothetical protein
MASTTKPMTTPILFRIREFLSTIYSSLLRSYETPERTFAKENKVELVPKARGRLYDPERTICLRTRTDDA